MKNIKKKTNNEVAYILNYNLQVQLSQHVTYKLLQAFPTIK